MKIAGVRCNGHTHWSDAGEHELSPWDLVCLDLDGVACEGRVIVCPEQWIQGPPTVHGTIRHIIATQRDGQGTCPATDSDVPPLGSSVPIESGEGLVVAIDRLAKTVTARISEDSSVVIHLDSVPADASGA